MYQSAKKPSRPASAVQPRREASSPEQTARTAAPIEAPLLPQGANPTPSGEERVTRTPDPTVEGEQYPRPQGAPSQTEQAQPSPLPKASAEEAQPSPLPNASAEGAQPSPLPNASAGETQPRRTPPFFEPYSFSPSLTGSPELQPPQGGVRPTPSALPEEEQVARPTTELTEEERTQLEAAYAAFRAENTATGQLKVQTFLAQQAYPVGDVNLLISKRLGGLEYVFYELQTNANGIADNISLPAPPRGTSQSPNIPSPFSTYTLTAYKKGFLAAAPFEIEIFADIKSIQPIQMVPLVAQRPF